MADFAADRTRTAASGSRLRGLWAVALDLLWRRRMMIALPPIAGLAASLVLPVVAPNVSTASVEVLMVAGHAGAGGATTPVPAEPAILEARAALATTPAFLGRVADRLALEPGSPPLAAEEIGRRLIVTADGRAAVIRIAAVDASPGTAERVVVAIAGTLVAIVDETQGDLANQAGRRDMARLSAARMAMDAAEAALATFGRDHPSPGAPAQPDLGALHEARLAADSRLRRLGASTTGGLDSPVLAESALFPAIEPLLAPSLRSGQPRSAGRSHDAAASPARRRALDLAIGREVRRTTEALGQAVAQAAAREEAARADAGRSKVVTPADTLTPEDRQALRALEADVGFARAVYADLLRTRDERADDAPPPFQAARLLGPIETRTAPRRLSPSRTALVAGLGLLVGLAAALLADRLRPGFHDTAEIERTLGGRVIAALPRLHASTLTVDGRAVDPAGYLDRTPGSAFTEAIRGLRVILAPGDRTSTVVAVASADRGDGRSTLALCLAVSAAKAGRKTLLIDADTRHRGLTRSFEAENRPGLSDYLAGTASADDIVHRLGTGSSFWHLPSGTPEVTSPDLLANPAMAGLIERVRLAFDLVLIDTPPAAATPDAGLLAAVADTTLFVISWSRTPRRTVRRAHAGLRDVAPLRLVFNAVDEGRTTRYKPVLPSPGGATGIGRPGT